MTDLRKAAQQALEALSDCIEKFYAMRSIGVIDALPLQAVSGAQAITALRAALAQPDVANAMSTVVAAMQADPDYAWSWHCNIAMAFVDAGGDSYTANQGAARFMRTLAQVEPAHELPAQPDVQEPVTKTGKAYVDNLIDALLLPIAAMTASDLEELHCRCADMLLMYATPALAQPDVPKGWVLVPVEPTPEMWKAVSQFAHAGSVWDAMLAAAPKGGA